MSRAAIWLLVSPAASRRNTSISRAVSPSTEGERDGAVSSIGETATTCSLLGLRPSAASASSGVIACPSAHSVAKLSPPSWLRAAASVLVPSGPDVWPAGPKHTACVPYLLGSPLVSPAPAPPRAEQ